MALPPLPSGFQLETPTQAPPPPAPAPSQGLPPVPEGFQVEQPAAAAPPPVRDFMGVKPAATGDELIAGMTALTKRRASSQMLLDYLDASNTPGGDKVRDFISGPYAEFLKKNPKGSANVEWTLAEPQPDLSTGDIMWSGLKSGALRGYDDEWGGFWGAVGNKLGTTLGLNNSTASFGDIYNTVRDQERARKDAAYNQNRLAYGAGFLPGAFTGPAWLQGGRVGTAGSTMGNVAQAARAGGVTGAISGSGNAEDGMVDRLTGAGTGALLGAPFGVALYPVQQGVNALAGRLWERFNPWRSKEGIGWGPLNDRAPQDPARMRQVVDDMEASGVPPRPVDVVDESGRRVIRGATNKNTPAQQELADSANDIYVNVQGRVAKQAERISPRRGTARQVSRDIEAEQQAMGPTFDAVRNEPVAVSPEMLGVLGKAEGRATLRRAAKWLEPEDETKVVNFIRSLNDANKLDPRLPPPVRQQIIEQMFRDSPLTVDVIDKWARILAKTGNDSGMYKLAKEMVDTVRGAARQQHPDYDAALNEFAARAGVGEAAGGTGKFANTDILKSHPDDFVEGVSQASTAPAALPDVTGQPAMSEADALAMRARDTIRDRAMEGPAQAMGVARSVSRDYDQQARDAAMLGGQRAKELETAMGHEVSRVDNTRFIDPRLGSKSTPTAEDAAAVDSMFSAISTATGGKWGIVRAVANWAKEGGLRGIDAERLTREALSEDPAKVRGLIDFLEKRGIDRARSGGLIRAIQTGSIAGRAAGNIAGSEERPPPPNSVRAIMKEDRR